MAGMRSISRLRSLACAVLPALALLIAPPPLYPGAVPDACEAVVREANRSLRPGIDEEELVQVLRSLGVGGSGKLPGKFVTKEKARRAGWRPGRDLWSVPALRGKSIGGDRFADRERRLPREPGGWREADLDYKGGRRGPKRLVYSPGGRRSITVDHYSTFLEVPSCR